MKTITRRLERLEQRIPRSARRYSFSAVEYIEGWLVRKGIARLETESLAETRPALLLAGCYQEDTM